jgi:hypothetical protein
MSKKYDVQEEIECSYCDAEFYIEFDSKECSLSCCPFCGETLEEEYIEDDEE